MKRFLLKIIVPSLVLIMAVVVLWEFVLHAFPHEHMYKSHWMDRHAEEVQVLVLGSSNTNRAVIPNGLGLGRGFSCAGSSQDIQNDYWILQRYIDRMDSLKYVVLDLNYLSLFLNIDYDEDYAALRKKYAIYWGNPHCSVSALERLEVSRFNWLVWWQETLSRTDTIHEDGHASLAVEPYNDEYWRYYGWRTALEHTKVNDSTAMTIYSGNMACLRKIAEICAGRGVTVVLLSCPVHEYFRSFIEQRQLDVLHAATDSLCAEYHNVVYMDYMASPLFTADDMSNANHLNRRGALRFTQMVGDSIRNL